MNSKMKRPQQAGEGMIRIRILGTTPLIYNKFPERLLIGGCFRGAVIRSQTKPVNKDEAEKS